MLDQEIPNLTELENFVLNAKYNDTYAYYRGFSLTDTILSNQLRKIAFKFAIEGKVYLVQRKSAFYFDFIMIKASNPPILSLIPFNNEQLIERQQRRKQHGYQRTNELESNKRHYSVH